MKFLRAAPLLFALVVALVGGSSSAAAQKTYTFKKGQLVKVSSKLCGVINNKWTPVKKSGKSYVIDTSSKTRCRSLLSPTALKKGGLSKLPSAGSLVRQNAQAAWVSDPSGTPPILKDIPTISGGIKGLFWSPGVIDAILAGTASASQCSEFFVGATDGSSAGAVGCFSLQGVGYAFQNILEGGGGTCYMKGVSKNSLLNNGISVTDGSLPDGSLENVFVSPTGSQDRMVKVVIGGFGGGPSQTGFIKVDSSSKLTSAGLQYAYTSWFCEGSSATPNNRERVTVGINGEYTYSGVNSMNQMKFSNEIRGFLATSGSSVTFDATKDRSSETRGEFGTNGSFKGSVSISNDNVLRAKVFDNFGSGAHKQYAVSKFTGTGISSFRVPQSAVKDLFDAFGSQAFQGIFEYRADPSRYVSSPSSTLGDSLSEVDFNTDAFYQSPASVTPDFSGQSCSADAEVTLQMDFSSPALQQVAMSCMSERLSSMSFCNSDPMIAQAFQKYATSCGGGGGGQQPPT